MNTKIIKFIGYSGSGKTTLIEKIVEKLSAKGIKVATIKHDVHGLDIDKEGKDSYRYSKAGAKVSVVSSPDMTVYKIHKKLNLVDIISNIVEDNDLIIIEGYSSDGEYPTISVAREETGKGIKGDKNVLLAVASDYKDEKTVEMGYNCRNLDINNIDDIIDFINKHLKNTFK